MLRGFWKGVEEQYSFSGSSPARGVHACALGSGKPRSKSWLQHYEHLDFTSLSLSFLIYKMG